MDAVLQVFETDPATATVRSRSLFGKAPQVSPKFEFALDECVVETIPRGGMPDGRGSTFLLRKRDPDEDEARAAALDDAFAAPSGADAAPGPAHINAQWRRISLALPACPPSEYHRTRHAQAVAIDRHAPWDARSTPTALNPPCRRMA